jgi:hypothetical protein
MNELVPRLALADLAVALLLCKLERRRGLDPLLELGKAVPRAPDPRGAALEQQRRGALGRAASTAIVFRNFL